MDNFDIIVHTQTLENYTETLKYFINSGFTWRGSKNIRKMNKEYWMIWENETCIRAYNNFITFGDCRCFIKLNMNILNMKEFRNKIKANEILKEFI